MADTPNTSSEAGELYLDAAATEPVSPAVLEAMTPFLTDAYANPASVHQPGKTAARALDAARASFAAALGARPDDVIFTSGGTESDNLAIKGIAMARMRQLGLQPFYGLAEDDGEQFGTDLADPSALSQPGEQTTNHRPRIIISAIDHQAVANRRHGCMNGSVSTSCIFPWMRKRISISTRWNTSSTARRGIAPRSSPPCWPTTRSALWSRWRSWFA